MRRDVEAEHTQISIRNQQSRICVAPLCLAAEQPGCCEEGGAPPKNLTMCERELRVLVRLGSGVVRLCEREQYVEFDDKEYAAGQKKMCEVRRR